MFLKSLWASLKNLDVTDLQTFAIISSQVNSTRHNNKNLGQKDGKMERQTNKQTNIICQMLSCSATKNLDVTDLQTFAIIWSQVVSARHNKGNMEVFSDKRAVNI